MGCASLCSMTELNHCFFFSLLDGLFCGKTYFKLALLQRFKNARELFQKFFFIYRFLVVRFTSLKEKVSKDIFSCPPLQCSTVGLLLLCCYCTTLLSLCCCTTVLLFTVENVLQHDCPSNHVAEAHAVDRNLPRDLPSHITHSWIVKVANDIVSCLQKYGIAVVNKFLGTELGNKILDEVWISHSSTVVPFVAVS